MNVKKRTRWLVVFGVGLLVYFSLFFVNWKEQPVVFGVSFDPAQARHLGLDATTTFSTLLDDWGFKYVRLSASWKSVEPEPSRFDFSELDAMMAEAAARGVKVILVVGQKTPRWPECHHPVWSTSLPPAERRAALGKYLTATVEHFRAHPALEIWQVENEPFIYFGVCPPFSGADLVAELALVKTLDPAHPTLVTDSGEVATWRRTARAADLFGTTVYRMVWNSVIGYWSYDWLPPAVYRFRLWLLGRLPQSAFISELQAEPWVPRGNLPAIPLAEQFVSMSLGQLQRNVAYARRIGLPRAYLWGAEWWRWLAANGHPEFADYIKQLPKR